MVMNFVSSSKARKERDPLPSKKCYNMRRRVNSFYKNIWGLLHNYVEHIFHCGKIKMVKMTMIMRVRD